MRKILQFPIYVGIAGAFLFLLAGCDYSKQKAAHVKIETVSHEVVFDKGKRHLSKSEFDALDVFTKSVPVAAVSYVGLVADDSNPVSVRYAKQIKTYLVKQGIDPNYIYLQPASGSDDGHVSIVMEYSVAVPPQPCPDWSKSSTGTYNSTVHTKFGCAYYTDFTFQVDNPEEFEHARGQEFTPDAERDAALVTKYRGGSAAPAAASASR